MCEVRESRSAVCLCSIITAHKVIFIGGFVNDESLRLAFIACIILSIVFSVAAFVMRLVLANSVRKSIISATTAAPESIAVRITRRLSISEGKRGASTEVTISICCACANGWHTLVCTAGDANPRLRLRLARYSHSTA
jgi:hypothetical protein